MLLELDENHRPEVKNDVEYIVKQQEAQFNKVINLLNFRNSMIPFNGLSLNTTTQKNYWPKFSKKSTQWSSTKSPKRPSLNNFIHNSAHKMSTTTSRKSMKWNRTVTTILRALWPQEKKQRPCSRPKSRILRSDLQNWWKDLLKASMVSRPPWPNLITFLPTKDSAKPTRPFALKSPKAKTQQKESKDLVVLMLISGGYPINLLESPVTK